LNEAPGAIVFGIVGAGRGVRSPSVPFKVLPLIKVPLGLYTPKTPLLLIYAYDPASQGPGVLAHQLSATLGVHRQRFPSGCIIRFATPVEA